MENNNISEGTAIRLANIEPHRFQKGRSGNPAGRPKKLPALDELMAKCLAREKDGITAMEIILNRLRNEAARGNIKAAEILLDRAYGKATQNINQQTTLIGHITHGIDQSKLTDSTLREIASFAPDTTPGESGTIETTPE